MEKIILELPQLILVENGLNRYRYLERLPLETNEPRVNLTFQEDSKEDPRIITIKYSLMDGKSNGFVLYYSESENRNAIITANLGQNYFGRVLVIDKNDHKIGFNLEHLPKEGLRLSHLERINQINDINRGLTLDYVVKRYKDMFYQLKKYT